jgi:hypothetical protein
MNQNLFKVYSKCKKKKKNTPKIYLFKKEKLEITKFLVFIFGVLTISGKEVILVNLTRFNLYIKPSHFATSFEHQT